MSRKSSPQFTLRRLAMAVAFLVLALIALTQASRWWLAVISTTTLLIFLTATVAVVYSRGSIRAHWIGFCLWGLTYLLLTSVILKDENDRKGTIVTTRIVEAVYSLVVREVPLAASAGGGFSGGGVGRMVTYKPDYDIFVSIGQQMWSWLFAIIGGYVAKLFAQRGMDHDANAT